MAEPADVDDGGRASWPATIAAQRAAHDPRHQGSAPAHPGRAARLDAGRRSTTSIAMCYASDDFKEGVAAFLAKRPPLFNGR